MFAKVQDHDNLIRDMQSKAVLNTDKAGLQDYLQKRDQAKKELSEKAETKQRLAKIEEEMSEIKYLLREIAQGSR
jgi:t-SNARE complex subunit (syntaxin)